MQIASGTLLVAHAILFDMDGTLVDSTLAVERIWGRWARSRDVPFEHFAQRMHGRRAIDIMREMVPPGLDALEELRQVDADELNETDGIVALPGAAELIASLPAGSWALVTSASAALARARMCAAGLPLPEIVVSSDDVRQGKPHPACYQHALKALGLPASQALVFEDAPAGLAAGRAAGCRTIALATTTPHQQFGDQDWIDNLSCVALNDVSAEGLLQLRIG